MGITKEQYYEWFYKFIIEKMFSYDSRFADKLKHIFKNETGQDAPIV